MIVQNTNTTTQTAQPERHISSDGPKLVSESAKAPDVTATQDISSQSLRSAVDSVNQALQQSSQSLEISIDSATKQNIVKLVDSNTGELLRQIPSKEMLAIAQSIDKFLQHGQLLSEKA